MTVFTIVGWATVPIAVHYGIRIAQHFGVGTKPGNPMPAELVGLGFGLFVAGLWVWGAA